MARARQPVDHAPLRPAEEQTRRQPDISGQILSCCELTAGQFCRIVFGVLRLNRIFRSLLRRPQDHATAATLSVTLSSCPTVSLPNRIGMKAPTATTPIIVPKKIVGEPVCG